MAELVEEFDVEHVTRYKCQMSGCPIVSTIEAPVCEDHLAQIGQVFLETRSVAGSFLALKNVLAEKREADQRADHDASLLLAVEPGGYGVESQRHAEFDPERVWANRELFNPSRRLLAHIESVRSQFGLPAAA